MCIFQLGPCRDVEGRLKWGRTLRALHTFMKQDLWARDCNGRTKEARPRVSGQGSKNYHFCPYGAGEEQGRLNEGAGQKSYLLCTAWAQKQRNQARIDTNFEGGEKTPSQ